MGKKNKQRKNKPQGSPATANSRATNTRAPREAGPKGTVAARLPEIPAFWVALIIPVICLVGAWTYPPVATPMELKSYASQIYLSGLFLAWFWLLRKQRSATLTFSPARVAFGLLFLAGTLSLLWAANHSFWVYKWNKWYTGLVMFVLGLHITQTRENMDRIINLAIVGGLIVAVIGIAQYLFGFDGVPQTAFPSSTFGNGNMAGQVMVFTAFLPLYFLFRRDLPNNRVWYYALSLTLLLTYTFYTRTRAVWLAISLEAALIGIFILLDRTGRREWLAWNREKTTAGAVALAALLILVNFNQEGFRPFWQIAMYELSSISTSIASTSNQIGGERYLIWGTTIDIIKAHPFFGTGLGSFFHDVNVGDFQQYRVIGVQRAHNDVLELMVELGAFGMLLLLGIIVTVCIRIYKLILHSTGTFRILFALLLIAVTGSMFNAQLSFPYQLPVPTVIMPFFMALVIRGAENIENNTRTITLKPWFNKAALSASALLFVFITANDLTWMRDIDALNKVVSNGTGGEWKPVNPIYNQAYITGARSVAQALRTMDGDELSIRVIKPLLDYWPQSTANTSMAAENYLNMGNYEQAEYWAKETRENQMTGTFLGEFYLMQIYSRTGRTDDLRQLYEFLKQQPESQLSQQQNNYNILHTMSINLQDFEMTPVFFEKFMEYFGESAPVIANQAVYYMNIGDVPGALPYMKRALELDPDVPLAAQFKQILSQYADQ